MAKRETKNYRLLRGTHRVVNPDFKAGDPPETSHRIAEKGDLVPLSDEQFKAFKDKFAPVDTDGTDIRDADDAQLEEAKAKAVRTGQTVNPNETAPPKSTTTTTAPSGAQTKTT